MSTFEDQMRERGLTFTWLAIRLGLNKSSTTRWARYGVPAERVLEVENTTGISRHVIRPDLYPEEGRPFRPEDACDTPAQTAPVPMASEEVSEAAE